VTRARDPSARRADLSAPTGRGRPQSARGEKERDRREVFRHLGPPPAVETAALPVFGARSDTGTGATNATAHGERAGQRSPPTRAQTSVPSRLREGGRERVLPLSPLS
jgi:hypothetical protein